MIKFDNQLLIVPEKADIERDSVTKVWLENGGEVLWLGRFWEPPPLDHTQVSLYGNDTFCLVLAQQLNLEMVSPPDDLLIHVNYKWLTRHLQVYTLAHVENLTFPQFVKPLVPKQFRANVYQSQEDLYDECKGLEVDTLVMVSQIVNFSAEARAFILDREVKTCAIYEGVGDMQEANRFVSAFVMENDLPKTCVIDVGCLPNNGWAVIETNATWGAGLNGCDPLGAAECIAQATVSA